MVSVAGSVFRESFWNTILNQRCLLANKVNPNSEKAKPVKNKSIVAFVLILISLLAILFSNNTYVIFIALIFVIFVLPMLIMGMGFLEQIRNPDKENPDED